MFIINNNLAIILGFGIVFVTYMKDKKGEDDDTLFIQKHIFAS
jgi:hypothetical protein